MAGLRLPKVITFEEEKLLINACYSIRDKAIIKFMVNTGLRVSEMCKLSFDQLDLNNKYIKIIGKRDKERIITLNDEALRYLSDYLSSKKHTSTIIFSTKSGSQLSRNAVWMMLRKSCIRAGLTEKIHPHMLRHTFCTRLTENNVPIERVAELAGHSKLDTTRIYAKVSLTKKHTAVKSLNHNSFLSALFQKHKESKLRKSIPIPKRVTEFGFIPEIRGSEISRIRENIRLKIHTCLIGYEGYGKSSIINYFKSESNVLYFDHLETKQDLYDLFEILHNASFFNEYADFKELKKEVAPLSVTNMLKLIDKNISEDYVLLIDDCTGLTPKMKRVFATLSGLFCIVTSSERKHDIIMDKFDMIQVSLLSRHDTIIVINSLVDTSHLNEKQLLQMFDIIYSRTHGFPRAIVEMCDKLRKNNYSVYSLQNDSYSNPSNQKSIGWLLLLIVFIMVAFVLKFSTTGFAAGTIVYIGVILLRVFILRGVSR